MTSTTESNKRVVLRLYTQALNQGRFEEVVDEVVGTEAVTHDGAAPGVRGLAATKRTMRALHAAFTDMNFTVDDIIAEDDTVAVRWHMSGTHTGAFAGQPASGKRLTQQGTVFYRLEGALVTDVWPLIDRLGLLQQIVESRTGTTGATAEVER